MAKTGKPKPGAGGVTVARAVAAAMRRRSRRAWILVEYVEADWTHGYCTGDRKSAWKASSSELTRVKPPAILEVPYAQFCASGTRVLVESSTVNGSGLGEVFQLVRSKGAATLHSTEDGVRWRVGP